MRNHGFSVRHLMAGLLTSTTLAGLIAIATPANAQMLPTGGTVTAGSATIATASNAVTITQSTQNAAINWDSFGIAAGNRVEFAQPNGNSVALNRVTGPDPSVILGSLNANGKVFLVNPNGVLFGQSAQVNVGGLLASTLGISDTDFMAGRYDFAGPSRAAVLNQGSIIAADGGYVALLGANIGNQGLIVARLGMVALAAGQAVTLDVAGDGLLNVTVNKGAIDALIANGGLIRADGGQVLLTAQAAGALLHTVVNNSGVIEAHTIVDRAGTIRLLGDMESGTTNLAGTLDASAPAGGAGGSIETSAAHVVIADSAIVTTVAAAGSAGTWLIDPQDFIIGAGGNISGATLSALLVTNNVTISTLPGDQVTTPGTPPTTTIGTTLTGNGDIIVNDAVAWTASPSTTTLRLNAVRDIVFNASVTATNGNIVACCGRDVIVQGALTTTNGSILLNAGRTVNLVGAVTTTDGNLAFCAALDVMIVGAVTLTRGTTIPSQSLSLAPGLLIVTGAGGNGAGTLTFAPLAPPITVTGPNATAVINYNPASYAVPTDYSGRFVLSQGASVTEHMLLFPAGDKVAEGTTATTLAGFNTTVTSGLPTGVSLVAGPGSSADFDSADPGSGIGITYSGYTLAGPNADAYALAGSCCVSTFRTTGTITPAPIIVPPVVTPPVVTPPVVVPPVEVPPVVVPPVETPVVTPPVVVPPVETPVVTPPVVAPPVETPVVIPPVVVPPVETPVVTPPVVVPPVETPVVSPPVVVPPVETPVVTPPVVVPPVETPVVTPPVVVPPVETTVETPPIVVPAEKPISPNLVPTSATLIDQAPPSPLLAAYGPSFVVLDHGVAAPVDQMTSIRPVTVAARQPALPDRVIAPVPGPEIPSTIVGPLPPKRSRH